MKHNALTTKKYDNELTDLEKMAIVFRLFQGLTWERAYALCHPDYIPSGQPGYSQHKRSLASKWKLSPSVQSYNALVEEMDHQRTGAAAGMKQIEIAKEKEDGKRGTVLPGVIDFTDVESFLKFASQQANRLTDERDRQGYLKMIADLMRFKEQGTKDNEDIKRYYLPLQCSICPLKNR